MKIEIKLSVLVFCVVLFGQISAIKQGQPCGEKTITCPCQPGSSSIDMKIILCQTNSNTCEPCDQVDDKIKCRIYQIYCNKSVTINSNHKTATSIINDTGRCPCQNGGKCDTVTNDSLCSCPSGFSGQLCQFHDELTIEKSQLTTEHFLLQTEQESALLHSNSTKFCEKPDRFDNGVVVFDNAEDTTIPGEYIRYNCSDGYALIGNVTRYCDDTGQFSGTTPVCEKICTIPEMVHYKLYYVINPNHQNEKVVDRFGTVMITELEFFCEDDYKIEGPSRIRCVNGVWDNKPPVCLWIGVTCATPVSSSVDLIQEPKVSSTTVNPGSVFSFSCANGATLVGEPHIVCTYSGTWVPEPPSCISMTLETSMTEVSCPIPPQPRNGEVRLSFLPSELNKYNNESLVSVGTRVTYSCNQQYQLAVGSTERQCLANGRWNGKEPKCVIECGRTSEPKFYQIINGSDIDILKWPWQVGLYDLFSQALFCGGTILNEAWVLTAAHCVSKMVDGQLTLAHKEKLGLFFGQSNSKPDGMITRKALDIVKNEKYDPYTSNSDIALILLDVKLTFNNKIKPVCLPRATSNLADITNSVGMVAGWGRTDPKIDAISLQLKFIEVKVVSNDMCRKTYADKLHSGFPSDITSDMFCTATERMGTCQGDSGGSLCVLTGPTDNEVFQIEGIVSWGSFKGCATPGQFDVYTRVRNYISWIELYINTVPD